MAVAWAVAGVIFSAPEINILPRRGVSRAIFGEGVFRSDVAELRVLQPLLAHVIEPWVVSLSEPLLLLPVLLAHEFLEVFHHQLLLVGAQFFAEDVVQISLLPLRYVAAFQCFLQGFELSRGEIVLENLLGEVLLLLIQLRMAITRPVAGVIFSAPEINILPRRGVSRAIFGDGVFRSEVAELRVLQPLLAHVIEPWVVSLSEPLLLLPVL